MIVRSEPCQAFNIIGTHPAWKGSWLGYGIRAHVRRCFKRYRNRLGRASTFKEGDWVRVRDRAEIERTLNPDGRLRGLMFLPYQAAYCGGVYRVQRVVRRIIDDHRLFRPMSYTVLLEGATCTSEQTGMEGCGRRCPLMFRDEWLVPAKPEEIPVRNATPGPARFVEIRSVEEIRQTLDWRHKRDGVSFMPEMYKWAGKRVRVVQQVQAVREFGKTVPPRRPVFILDGMTCSGAALGRREVCDRACPILWHTDWLRDD
ncbi:MAG TPA: hypothetical protein VIC33_17090 [Vicinamibacterales bacterium]|jgi:hypothetical protein